MSHSLPEAFQTRVLHDPFLGQTLLDALETVPPVSLRHNPFKQRAVFAESTPVPWSPMGVFLPERPSFTLDPLFHAGCYYPQEAGSQLLAAVLAELQLPEEPVVLDLCAAPGGKSTLIASHLNGKGLLVSNEVIQQRSRILKENLTKWGIHNVVVSNNDPADFNGLTETFDCIVTDVPCSGEGMFRKDHQARNEWSEANVALCSSRQRRIIMDIWSSLREGGYLVYSTCTFNRMENEDNVAWFAQELDAEIVRIALPLATEDRTGTGWYALPDKLDTEGFYISVLRKRHAQGRSPKPGRNTKLTAVKEVTPFSSFIRTEGITVLQWQDFHFAVPESHTTLIQQLHLHLRTIQIGTEIGELTRKGLIPHEALALNPFLRHPELPQTDLDKDQALSYLHGDTFPLNGKAGFQLVSYAHEPLGWIKHLGNRFNNLYPKEWRIRMQIR